MAQPLVWTINLNLYHWSGDSSNERKKNCNLRKFIYPITDSKIRKFTENDQFWSFFFFVCLFWLMRELNPMLPLVPPLIVVLKWFIKNSPSNSVMKVIHCCFGEVSRLLDIDDLSQQLSVKILYKNVPKCLFHFVLYIFFFIFYSAAEVSMRRSGASSIPSGRSIYTHPDSSDWLCI